MSEQIKEAFRVFLFGFGGVFTGLILLMWGIKISTLLIRLFTSRKN